VIPVANSGSAPTQKFGAFYEDLEKLLLQQLKQQPQMLDLRLKLAELYYETRRADEFLRHARQMRSQVKDPQKSDEWRKVLSMGRMMVPGDPLFSESGGDTIEFVVPKTAAPQSTYTRIGDEERFRKPLLALAEGYEEIRKDPRFINELDMELMQSAGHPSSLQPARRLSKYLGGAQIYFKREDLNSRIAYLTSAVVGQALLARRMGKKSLVTGSVNGRSGVIVASIAARLGLHAVVYMDPEQMRLQTSNVFRMWLMGASVTEADMGRYKKPDVRQAAWDHWGANPKDCFLVMGLDAAPHPYPMMALEFASVVGRECRRQLYMNEKKVADLLVARAGDNADAIGFFPPFLKIPTTRLVCVEAPDSLDEGKGVEPAARAGISRDPVAAQPLTMREQQRAAQILEGMDYPRVTREHAWLKASGRVEYVSTTAAAAKKAINDLSRNEGIIPAVQTAYAIAWACQESTRMKPEQSIIVMISENVDKNIWQIGKSMGVPL
jgi:tryptophan synthase beta chain